MADGSGSDDVNVICVERILDLLADYLLDYFNDICRRDNGKCAYAILITVIRVIGEIMENENRKKEDLGSTLMGVCIDKVSNRFCYVHLGNGIIAYGKKDRGSTKHRVGILSRPNDGTEMDQVILTISDCAGQALKLSSGKLKDITGFILMTDGVLNGTHANECLQFVKHLIERTSCLTLSHWQIILCQTEHITLLE